MKYEPVFGDQSLFDKATRKNTVAIYKISENLTVEFDKYEELLAFLQQQPLCDHPDIAMRRIIRTPTWSVADQKAGKLPPVGSRYMGEDGQELTCVLIDAFYDVWGANDDLTVFVWERSRISPIETPEEKAARLREEWVSKATFMTTYEIYDDLLSGDLPVPVKGE